MRNYRLFRCLLGGVDFVCRTGAWRKCWAECANEGSFEVVFRVMMDDDDDDDDDIELFLLVAQKVFRTCCASTVG